MLNSTVFGRIPIVLIRNPINFKRICINNFNKISIKFLTGFLLNVIGFLLTVAAVQLIEIGVELSSKRISIILIATPLKFILILFE